MMYSKFGLSLISLYIFGIANAQKSVCGNQNKLLKHYTQIQSIENNIVTFKDKSTLLFDDGKEKNFYQRLTEADIEDQFHQTYPKGMLPKSIEKNMDPGRFRNEAFYKKVYGNTKMEVEQNLVEIIWCPKLVNQKIKVTKINGVSDKLIAISAELDKHPEWVNYISNIGGTFHWRLIKGTKRLSHHSFGTTLDLNVKYSNYWQWDYKTSDETKNLGYKNRIPQGIVDIFEKHGFIWGGKWYHYDTMHFEYRPELF